MLPTGRVKADSSNSFTIWPRGKHPRSPPFAAVESSEYLRARAAKSSPVLARFRIARAFVSVFAATSGAAWSPTLKRMCAAQRCSPTL